MPGPKARRTRARPVAEVSSHLPVAQVMIDASVPHLDRPFDYAVPAQLADSAVVGSHVRVRFAGRLTDGYIVARLDAASIDGALKPLDRVIGVEPVLTAETIALVREVAERGAGTFSDVVRAAVPPRHARAESGAVGAATWPAVDRSVPRQQWALYGGGRALIDRVAEADEPVRAVWSLAPATDWTADVVALVEAAAPQGGAIVVVPDATDVDRVLARLEHGRAAGSVATLTADQGPERRYREFLRILRGGARVVVGTRSAVFAPVRDLRLVVVWDDGDDALVDPHAPYWDARDVAALRSHLEGVHLAVGSPARSVATQQWCESGWAKSLAATRGTLASRAPVVRALSSEDAARDEAAAAARIPHTAWRVARSALSSGPVLLQVGRRGYVPALACSSCREIARCTCGGPLELPSGSSVPQCTWCGRVAGDWTCSSCGKRGLRAVAVGAERTAEEIGRAFPGVSVVASHGGKVITTIGDERAIVVATPGAEPIAVSGYAAVVILDARASLSRPYLDAEEDSARRWFAAARLARPKATVVVTADNGLPAVQSLVRWDAPWLARRELADRRAAGLPPATRVAALTGLASDIDALVAELTVPHVLLGPVPHGSSMRALVVVERNVGLELARQLRSITMSRSARAKTGVVHVRLDPRDI